MRVIIEAESQEEFEHKRADLIRTLAGRDIEVIRKAKPRTIYQDERPALTPRRTVLSAQNKIMDIWDEKYQTMVQGIKDDINEIIS